MDPFYQILLTIAGSSGLTGIVSLFLQRRWARKDKEEDRLAAVIDAQRVLMIDRVEHLGGVYIARGYITMREKESIRRMYQAAKGLGMNGDLDTVMAEIDKLPIRQEERT